MAEPTVKTWQSFEDEALRLVRSPSAAAFAGGRLPWLRLVRDEAFGNVESWEVLADESGRPASVVHRLWLRARDLPDLDAMDESAPDLGEPGFEGYHDSLLPAAPTLEERSFPLPTAIADAIAQALNGLRIPVTAADERVLASLDGTAYEAHFRGRGGEEVSVRWSCGGPKPWQGFTSRMFGLLRLLEGVGKSTK